MTVIFDGAYSYENFDEKHFGDEENDFDGAEVVHVVDEAVGELNFGKTSLIHNQVLLYHFYLLGMKVKMLVKQMLIL